MGLLDSDKFFLSICVTSTSYKKCRLCVSEDPDLASVEYSIGPEALRFSGLITGGIALQEVPKDSGQKKEIYLQVQRDRGRRTCPQNKRKSLEKLEKFRGQKDWRTGSLREDKKQMTPV
jgi:hypothetical protein